jgi:CheY-like chemotaxis protein
MVGSTAGEETILMVEDEPAVRSLVTRVLSARGYNVLAAATADEALALAQQTDSAPHLMLTDIVLPGGLRGDELAAQLQLMWPGLPVVYMSGYARDSVIQSERLGQGIAYLEKPFTPETLLQTVRRVLDTHHGT